MYVCAYVYIYIYIYMYIYHHHHHYVMSLARLPLSANSPIVLSLRQVFQATSRILT